MPAAARHAEPAFASIARAGRSADVPRWRATEDFVITTAEFRGGALIATAMIDAQEQPSVVISGNVFVTHPYTRRPD